MTYDSLMPHAALYRAWMREQAERAEETGVELLIGVSVLSSFWRLGPVSQNARPLKIPYSRLAWARGSA